MKRDKIKRKNVLVSGGYRGIGAAMCHALARDGHHVLINCRERNTEAESLAHLVQSEGGSAELIPFDVTDQTSIATALQAHGVRRLHVLVNNAGILRDNLLLNTSEQDWDAVLKVNFLGMLNTFKASLHALRAAHGATVVNIASISGFRGGKGQCSYATSKAMVIEWTRQMAFSCEKNLRFFSISPGPVATEMVKGTPFYQNVDARKLIPLNRFAEPDEIGQLTCYLVSARNALQNGSNWVIDGGFTLSPKR